MRPLLALALLVAFAPAAPVPKGIKKQNDQERIVGRWLAQNGRGHSFVYNEDGTMKVWDGAMEPVGGANYKWTIDPTVTPKRMTWYGVGGTAPQYECVYELDGDELKITYESAPKIPTAVGGGSQNHRMTRDPAK